MKQTTSAVAVLDSRLPFKLFILATVVAVFLILPSTSLAASNKAEVAGWIPYWAADAGIKSASDNIDKLDTIYPFVYEIKPDGTLVNKVDFNDKEWEDLFDLARDNDVEIIPSVAWFDGAAIHSTLSSKTKRKKQVSAIAAEVKKYDFDGIDIDYEGKKSETIDHFSTFLKEVDKAIGSKKILACTVEARTPSDSLYRDVPKTIKYANDYEKINEYCDRVEIMAYDQQRADLKLNDERRGVPYMPVADKDWVEKVVKLAVKDIDEDKIMLGVPTYGRAWDITVAPDWYKDYKKVATLNQPRIMELSKIYNSPIGRTVGGEAVISYFPEDSVYKVFNALPTPAGTPKGFEAAAKALLVANVAKIDIPVRFVTWGDGKAIEDKLKLIEEYDLRGVAIFKIDGEEDQAIWKLFK